MPTSRWRGVYAGDDPVEGAGRGVGGDAPGGHDRQRLPCVLVDDIEQRAGRRSCCATIGHRFSMQLAASEVRALTLLGIVRALGASESAAVEVGVGGEPRSVREPGAGADLSEDPSVAVSAAERTRRSWPSRRPRPRPWRHRRPAGASRVVCAALGQACGRARSAESDLPGRTRDGSETPTFAKPEADRR